MEYISPFQDIGKNDALLAGGKGASLGEMTQAGFPIPPGFVVLSKSFQEFVKENDLNVEIDAVLDTVDLEKMHTIENASEKIQALILNSKMPKQIADQIEKAFEKLGAKYVAVRSSATSEDSADAAWAGQLDTFLNTKQKNLLENVKKCWASLFTPRAIFYRFEKGLHKKEISVAVVVQKMVESEESGIAFSVHPVTQDENQLIIEAGFGLGEAIVSGQITPDSYVVDKQDWHIIDINVNEQSKGIYRSEEKDNEWRELGAKGETQVLSEKEIIELSKVIVNIENHYGFPVDVEWAKEKNKIYITQSRPITTLMNKVVPSEGTYVLGNQDVDTSFLTLEMTWRGMEDPEIEKQVGMKAIKSFAEIIEGKTMNYYVPKDDLKEFSNTCSKKLLDKKLRDYLEKNTIRTAKAIRDFSKKYVDKIDDLSNEEIANIFPEVAKLQEECMNYGDVVAFADILGQISDKVMEAINKRKNLKHPKHIYSNILANPEEKSLTEKANEDIKKGKKSDAQLLKEYFWLEQGYIGRGLNKELLNEIKQGKSEKIDLDRKELLKEVKLSKEEENIFEISQLLIKVKSLRADSRQFGHVLTNKLVDRIAKEQNIEPKYLESMIAEEISDYVLKGNLPEQIKERWQHSIMESSLTSDYSFIIEEKEIEKYLQQNLYKEEIEEKDHILGKVAQVGFAKGKVRLVFGPQHNSKVQEGDILVSRATSPQLLPAMKKAGAIVTDLGGITSHAAIVSRELNKPCVVGTKYATQVLKDGDLVEVDAEKGVVHILNNKEEKLLVEKYFKAIEGQIIHNPVPNFSTLACSLRWSSGKYYSKHYDNYVPLPVFGTMKGKDSVGVFSATHGEAATREVFTKYWKNEKTLKEILDKQKKYTEKLNKYHEKLTLEYVEKKNTKDLIKELKTALDDEININSLGWFAMFWDMEFCLALLSEVNSKISSKRISEIWDQAVIPTTESFEKRSSRLILDLINKKLDFDQIAIPAQYIYAGFYGVDPLENIEKDLEKEYKSFDEKKIKKTLETLDKEKEKTDKEFKKWSSSLSEEEFKLINFIQTSITMRDMLRDYVGKFMVILDRISSKILKESRIDHKFLHYMTFDEITENNLDKIKDELPEREKGISILAHTDDKLELKLGDYEDNKKQLEEFYFKQQGVDITKEVSEIQGQIACAGNVKGKAKIIMNPKTEADKMNKGDILITGMTRPEFVPLMKKASAIVTDEGGITSHAAIVSRELKKPCIIGTKIATEVLKDGDFVEVDANNGVVKIIKKELISIFSLQPSLERVA